MSKYTFNCVSCDKEIEMNSYAVAQLASNNTLVYICECNGKTILSKKNLYEN